MDFNEVKEAFDLFNGDFTKFEQIEDPMLTKRADLYAFMLLDDFFPDDRDMISGAEHDVIYLSVDMDRFRDAATFDLVHDLVRCGVMYHEEHDCLWMFV